MFANKLPRQTPTLPAAYARQLRGTVPLRHLAASAFEKVCASAELITRPSGQPLLHVPAQQAFLYYLLKGTVEIRTADGMRYAISAEQSEEASLPLRSESETLAGAVAKTEVVLAGIPAAIISEHLTANRAEDLQVVEIEPDAEQPDQRLLYEIYHRFMENSVEIPSLPDIALRVREAAQDPHIDARRLAQIIQMDPAVAAQLVRVANNAAYAGATPVGGIREAVIRIGSSGTRDLVLAICTRHLFHADNRFCKSAMRAAWRHGCSAGATSFVIAKHAARLNPEQALLAGLVHEIGAPVLIAEAEHSGEPPANMATLCAIIRGLAAPVGAMVLRQWRFSDSIIDVMLNAENWDTPRNPPAELTLLDVLQLAHACDASHAPPWANAAPVAAQLPAASKLPAQMLGTGGELKLPAEALREIEEAQAFLRT